MIKHLFVVNPTAHGASALAAEAGEICARMGLKYAVEVTGRAGDAVEIVSREARKGGEVRVYALGGDGTLNEAVRGAAGYGNVTLTQLPGGTGNDFTRCLGGKDAFTDIEAVISGCELPVDMIEVRLDDSPPIHAVNICSVGVDADVAAGVERYKRMRRWGSKAPYNISLAATLLRGVKRPYTVTVDKGTPPDRFSWQEDFTMLTCCNGQAYGGGFKACPDADPTDGQLEFLLVRGVSRLTITRIVGAYADGKYKELSKYIRHMPGRSMTVEAPAPFWVNYDGETVRARRAAFSLSPHKLRFIVPAGSYLPFSARSSQTAPTSSAE
ncbi:MAG: diacylglycerol kinase family lipid kinase [Oscillospiraceae bacterium]|jgi:YegS/Rv2252/BmrU family lipid kinase|nr:diacylglycerol kinase family lipid kinase [Oscillospiraceae bacterium]